MLDDEERILNLVGVALALVLVVSLGLIALSALSAQPADVPDAEWSLSRVNDSHVRVAHAGGEPVAVADLTVAVDGQVHHPSWSDDTLTEGEYGVVRADANATVMLLLEREAEKRQVLARWNGANSG